MLNNFIQTFDSFLSQGTENLQPIILFITTTVAIIDFTLACIYQYSEEFVNALKIFFQKIFKYTFLFALINYFPRIINYIIKLMFSIGFMFFPSESAFITGEDTVNFDMIYKHLLGSIIEINKERQKLGWAKFGDNLIYLAIIIIIGLIAIFLILKEILVSYIKLKTIATVGFFLVPFNAFEQTKAMGEKLFYGILSETGVLLTSICLTGVTLKVLQTREYASAATGNTITLGDLLTWLFMLLLCAFLVTQSKEFGGMLINGTAAGKGSTALAGALTSVATTGAAVVAASYTGGTSLAAGGARAAQAMKSGKNMKAVINSARKGMEEGRNYAQNTRLAKAGRRLNSSIQKTIAYGSGQRSLSNLGQDIVEGTLGEQTIGYNSEKMKTKREALFEDTIGELKDYTGTHNINNAIKSAKEEYTKALEQETKGLSEGEKVNKISKYKKAINSFMKEYNNKDKQTIYNAEKTRFENRKTFDNSENRKKWSEFRERDKFITGKDTWGKFRDTEQNRERFYKEKDKEKAKKDAFDNLSSADEKKS